ncbi:MAG: hypothetical protein N4A53_09070 [Pelagimonas sp.]|nr:hypothetical protein [Pelagimonas sp.]
MRILLVMTCAFLMGCDTGGPGFYGVDAVERSYDGTTFSIRVRGNLAEATRTNFEWGSDFREIWAKAGALTIHETGCKVAWYDGDGSVVRMGLSCNGQPPPMKPVKTPTLYCDLDNVTERNGTYSGRVECEL